MLPSLRSVLFSLFALKGAYHFGMCCLSFWLLAWGVSEKFPALFNSTKKQRLLRCSTLEYIKYSCGFAPCIRYFLANFPALLIYQIHPNKWGAVHMQQGAGVYRLLTLPRYTQKNRREFFNKASANAPAVVQ